MRTVCIDTSVLAVVAIVDDGEVVAEVSDPNPRRQAEGLGDLFRQCLAEASHEGPAADAGIDRIVVGTGPGPYTGLRAGLAFATALGMGLGVPVLGVSSQDILGLQAAKMLSDQGRAVALVITDARRKEVYYSVWEVDRGEVRLLAGPSVGKFEVALAEAREVSEPEAFFFGAVPVHLESHLQGVGAHRGELAVSLLHECAERVGSGESSEFSLEPQYLRRPDVNVPSGSKAGVGAGSGSGSGSGSDTATVSGSGSMSGSGSGSGSDSKSGVAPSPGSDSKSGVAPSPGSDTATGPDSGRS